MKQIFFFPEQASTIAQDIDWIYFGLIAMSLFFTVAIGAAIAIFLIRYRRRSENEVGEYAGESHLLEYAWTGIPIVLSVFLFIWGAGPYLKVRDIPDDAMEIAVVGKQWMWKFQHPSGRREINDLHIPIGRPIHLKMISQDVIHSLFIPAFRIKQDALPMYYTSIWFEATKLGKYRIFCTEYCGKDHSIMGGTAHVMTAEDYEAWLQSDPADALKGTQQASPSDEFFPAEASGLVQAGYRTFNTLTCTQCHPHAGVGSGPTLTNLVGKESVLEGGRRVRVDDSYLRESILNPSAKVKKGYAPIMPAYRGRVSEEDLNALIAYLKYLKTPRSSE